MKLLNSGKLGLSYKLEWLFVGALFCIGFIGAGFLFAQWTVESSQSSPIPLMIFSVYDSLKMIGLICLYGCIAILCAWWVVLLKFENLLMYIMLGIIISLFFSYFIGMQVVQNVALINLVQVNL